MRATCPVHSIIYISTGNTLIL